MIDTKADRNNKTLIVKNLHMIDEKLDKGYFPALSSALIDFSEFNGCKKIDFSKNITPSVKKKISKYL